MKTLSLAVGGLALAALSSPVTAQWSQATPATSPAARSGAAMTFDANLGKIVLFGGTAGFSTSNETWSFDGTTWAQLAPTASPTGKTGMELVHDLVRGVTVMYGSLNTSPFGGASVDQTWEFDGTTWTQVFPVTTPGGLGNYGACFDIVRNRTVIYGGNANNFFPIAESGTWEYDGTNWSLITTAGSPGPLERPSMCFNVALGKTVLFGGIDPQFGGVDTTWLYDGTNWTVAPVVGVKPTARTGAKMAYDPARGVCVLSGGLDPMLGTPFLETWEFNGTAWSQVGSAISGRYNQSYAFLPTTGQVALFGGTDLATFSDLGDTWLFDAMSRTFGTGCAGSNGVPALAAAGAPRIGQTYSLTLSNLATASTFALMAIGLSDQNGPLGPLPLSLASYGMPGCSAFVSTDVVVLVGASAGSATWSASLPNDPGYVGLKLFHQGISIDAGVNAASLVVSNAHAGTIGQ
ncbi:MAG: hypothetical protein KA020_02040 [Planctomycetes bacterium]|nr:hypothetical protein [Planctomycetota bacterium]